MLTLTAVILVICYHLCPCLHASIPCSIILIIYLSEYFATLAAPPHPTASSPSLYALLAMAHLPLLALLQRIIPLRSLSLEGTTSWEIFLGTPPSWCSVTGSEEGVDLNSPSRVIAEGQLMHSLCALHHARMQMVISPQSLGCYPPS